MDVCFKQIYMQNISPKLKNIDLFLKTHEAPYDQSEVALILGMPTEELQQIMCNEAIKEINLIDFFTIVVHSSSYICQLIQRQWRYGMKSTYTPDIIAYIYELNISKVESAFEILKKSYITPDELMEVFEHISTSVFILNNTNA